MTRLKNKAILRVAVFALIMTVALWLLPTGLISAEGNSIAELQAAADAANTAVAEAQAAVDSANTTLAGAIIAADPYTKAVDDSQAAVDSAISVLAAAVEGQQITDAEVLLNEANAALTNAVTAMEPYVKAVNDAQAAVDLAVIALADAQSALDAANKALEEAISNNENAAGGENQDPGNIGDIINSNLNEVSLPTVFTDKPDYIPTEYVLVTGNGWMPGESVRLDFQETLLDPIYQQTITYFTKADINGAINDYQYLIDLRHIGASFVLTATGLTSGLTAQTNFTDGGDSYINYKELTIHKDFSPSDQTATATFYVKKDSTHWYNADGTTSHSEVTQTVNTNNGEVKWDIPKDATCYVYEKALTGYTTTINGSSIPAGGYSVTMSSDKTVTVLNTKDVDYKELTIHKDFSPSDQTATATFYVKKDSTHWYNADGTTSHSEVTQTVNTNNGEVKWDIPKDATCYVYEKALTGYTTTINGSSIPAGGYSVTMSSDKTVTVLNTKDVDYKELTIHKDFSPSDQTATATFYVKKDSTHWYNADGTTSHSEVTQTVNTNNGEVKWDIPKDATCYVYEKALTGYTTTINGNPIPAGGYSVTMSSDKTVTVLNTKDVVPPTEGTITIIKNVTGVMESDATFSFIADPAIPGHSNPIEIVVDKDTNTGSVTFDDVPFNTYVITESDPGSGFSITSTNPQSGVISVSEQTDSVTFTNAVVPTEGTITIIKNVTGVMESDATFSFIADPAIPGHSNPIEIVVDKDTNTGSVTFDDVPFNTYVITESDPGSGFSITSTNPQSGVISVSEQTDSVTFTNAVVVPPIRASLTVIKRDIEYKYTLEGALFGLFTDEACTPEDQALDALGNPVGNQRSGSDGMVIFTNLEPGTYWVKELEPPTGYGFAGPIMVVLGEDSGSSSRIMSFAAVDGEPGANITKEDLYNKTINYDDPRLQGFLRITKTDSVTGLPVQGATYVVLSGGSVLYRAVTAADGTITMTGFVWGAPYYIKEESAPAGYALDSTIYGPAIFGPTVLSYAFTVTNSPTGGGGTLNVAGITESVKVLAFTGIDPIIPISGGSAVITGLAMLFATLRRRHLKNWKRPEKDV